MDFLTLFEDSDVVGLEGEVALGESLEFGCEKGGFLALGGELVVELGELVFVVLGLCLFGEESVLLDLLDFLFEF